MNLKDKIKQISDTNSYVTNTKDNHRNDIIEIGDSKDNQNCYPQAKFIQWNNETNFSIRLDEDVKDSIHELKDGKFIWKSKDRKKEAHLYEVGSEDCYYNENGGFEFEVVLYNKPETNVIKYTIQTKGLDFYHQPELTYEERFKEVKILDEKKSNHFKKVYKTELKEVNFRPEHIIDSYAVYHSTKKNHNINENNYKTGKVFHIYRPFVKDSNDSTAWCILNIDEKTELLTITIPQKFIDNAIYPIYIDPTFGDTSTGGSQTAVWNNEALGCRFNVGVSANCSQLDIYCDKGGYSNSYMKGVIWNDDTNKSVVTNGVGGASSVIDSSTPSWKTSVFGTNPDIVSGNYYIGGVVDGDVDFYYDSSSQNYRYDWNNSYSSPTQLDVNQSGTDRSYSIYVTYTQPADKPNKISEELHYQLETNISANNNMISDNFNDNSIDSNWTEGNYDGGGSSSITEQNQRLELSAASGTTQYSGGYRTLSQDTVSGGWQVTLKILSVSSSIDLDGYGLLYLACGSDRLLQSDGHIGITVNGYGSSLSWYNDSTSLPSTPFYLKMKYDTNNIYMYSSTNGTSWTLRNTINDVTASDYRYVGIFIYVFTESSVNQTISGNVDDFVNEGYVIKETTDINIYESECGSDGTSCMTYSLQTCNDGTNVNYCQITTNLSHADMSKLRVRKGGVTYGVLKTFDKNE